MVQNISWLIRLTATRAPAAVLLIRLYVGVVFACEGILKFLRPDALGAGRFETAGIPAPGFFAYFDGVAEIICGVMLLVGLLTRLAAAPMIINMIGALLITKNAHTLGTRGTVSPRTRLVGFHPRIARRPGPTVRQPVSPHCRRGRSVV